MSTPIRSMPTPTGEYQTHFGSPPGSSSLAADCKNWENLCGKLLAEREKLRAELAQMRREYDACRKTLFHFQCRDYTPPDFDREQAFAHIDDKPTVEELIAELQNAPEN